MKIEKSIDTPVKWEPAKIGDIAKLIRVTCGDQSIILKGEAVFSHRDRHAVYNSEVLIIPNEESIFKHRKRST